MFIDLRTLSNMEIEFYVYDELVGKIVAKPKKFKTGSKGLYGFGKISDCNGNLYQVACNMTIIGSKNE